MSYERACALADVPDDEALAVTLGVQGVAIARDGDEVFAVEATCSPAAVGRSAGPASTCAPASRPGCRPPNRLPPFPSTSAEPTSTST